ncbi:MAG TPA: hypothetical protein VMS81_04490, partial [Methanomicrobiales archaeon]|nr:hypothetical protein [Methanomicrobiales archaeon]
MRAAQLAILALLALIVLVPGFIMQPGFAGEMPPATVVGYYFTGEGCSHCARVTPVLFGDWLARYPGLVVVEYEVWSHPENAAVMAGMGQALGVPDIVFGPNAAFVGDTPILSGVPPFLNRSFASPASRENLTSLGSLDIEGLQGYPLVWEGERVLIREGPGGNTTILRGLLSGIDPATELAAVNYVPLDPVTVTHEGASTRFEHALRVDGWVFAWNGEPLTNQTPFPGTPAPTTTPTGGACEPPAGFTAGQIIALAAVNAINPCALAVLVVILLGIITRNPGDRRRVLLSGLAFALSVFVFYLAYGLLLVSLLAAARNATLLASLLTRALGAVSIAIGLFHIREYRFPGGPAVGTGIPKGWRPLLGGFLDRITSPWGALVMGALVTLFLLPCNIGPYIIGCGILSIYGPVVALPYLLIYNLVFILPMLGITAVVYLGVTRIG